MIEKLKQDLQKLANPNKAKALQRFFKTAKGEYAEGDKFLGVIVPLQRQLVKKYWEDLNFKEVDKLVKSAIHEERLIGLLVLVEKYQRAQTQQDKLKIYKFYLARAKYVNNWDLVDLTAPKIVGNYLLSRNKAILLKLARSKNLWERRIAILATFEFIYNKNPQWALKISKILLYDKHDLIHKAVGWMLREVGKRCDEKYLINFLNKYAAKMPRTMLRYSIERLSKKLKIEYLLASK